MPHGEIPFRAKFALFMLFFLGFALNVLIFADLQWWHYVFKAPSAVSPETVEQLRQGIVHIQVPNCDSAQPSASGTGFVIKSNYVITTAQIIKDHQTCDSAITVTNFKGAPSTAEFVGYSESDDLALLRVSETGLPSLPLGASSTYENVQGVVPIFTIGYPLTGIASQQDQASISGVGSISQFDRAKNRFVTSGLNINPGNSGGPVFLQDQQRVLGVASTKLDVTVGEEIGWAVPIDTVKKFFRESVGQNLE